MATKKEQAPETKVVQEDAHVVQHLDRDPNDPRNREDQGQLPSLDDESQQTPKDYKGVTG